MIKKIFLVHHTHTDIGYTDVHNRVFDDYIKFFDEVLNYCKKTDDYPDEAKFRWTCETLWQVRHYFENRPEKINEFVKRVKEGRIEITGLYLNMTELYTIELIIRSFYFIKDLKENHGVEIKTAMNCDINGLSWNLPQILNKIGIKYLLMATNEIRAFAPSVISPFWWVSPDNSKVLVWNASRNCWYAEGRNIGFLESYEKVKKNLSEFIETFYGQYPFDAICIQVAMDNQPPSIEISKIIREWNKREKNPVIIFSTPAHFFAYMEKNYFNKFEEHKKAWPDWWADGNGSCAFETSLCLNNVKRVIENEIIYSFSEILGLLDYPSKKIDEIWENLFFFAEHTFGAEESIRAPFSVNSILQWQIKSNFVYNAHIENEKLYKKGIEILKEKNLLNIKENNTKNTSKPNDDFNIENDWYKIEIDRESGNIKSIYDKEIKEEIVDQNSIYAFNQYIYEEIVSPKGRNSIWDEEMIDKPLWSEERKTRDVKFARYFAKLNYSEKLKNEKSEKLVLKLDGKGCKNILSEIELGNEDKAIKIKNTLWKEQNTDPEGIYFAFPFKLNNPEVKISGPGKAVFMPEKEQLPQTSKDYYSVEDWVILKDPSKSILMYFQDAPLIQISDINTGKWLKKLEIKNGTIFSYIMNNYWYTNFKPFQNGIVSFEYLFTTKKGEIENSSGYKFSAKFTKPVYNELIDRIFEIDRENISILCFKKSYDGKGYVMCLKENDNIDTEFCLRFKISKNVRAYLSNPLEEKISEIYSANNCISYRIKPFEIIFFYLQ